MSKVLVICSGGLDSTVLLYKAIQEYGKENVVVLTTYYGSKHNTYERKMLDWQLRHLNLLNYRELNLSPIFEDNTDSVLLKGNGAIEHSTYAEQTDGKTPVKTYVPFRNGIFLSVATAEAMSWGCDVVWYGAHADDAAGAAYPDCSTAFVDKMRAAISEGTANAVLIEAPFVHLTKAQVVAEGVKLGMTEDEFRHTRSCYEDRPDPCHECATCRDRAAAFKANNLPEDL